MNKIAMIAIASLLLSGCPATDQSLYPSVLICYDTMSGATVTIPSSSRIYWTNGIWELRNTDGQLMYLHAADSDRCSAVTLDIAAKIAEANKNNNNNAKPQIQQLP